MLGFLYTGKRFKFHLHECLLYVMVILGFIARESHDPRKRNRCAKSKGIGRE